MVRLAIAAAAFAVGTALTLAVLALRRPFIPCVSAPPAVIDSRLWPDEAADTSSVGETIGRLRQFKVGGEEIPPPARTLLTRLKHQLRDSISATINAPESQGKSAGSLQARVLTKLSGEGVAVGEPKEEAVGEDYVEGDYLYGDIYSISVERPRSHPELLAVTTTLGVYCGSDSSLYLFKRVNGRWQLVLAQEANGYEDVSGAQGRFNYMISPPDAADNFFVVTANVNPWCTSNWQSIRYSVLRPGPDAYRPQVLASGDETIYLGVDRPYQLAAGADWFSLNFYGDASAEEIMDGEGTKRHVVKYIINGEKAKKASG
jgi:hypothetical protein